MSNVTKIVKNLTQTNQFEGVLISCLFLFFESNMKL